MIPDDRSRTINEKFIRQGGEIAKTFERSLRVSSFLVIISSTNEVFTVMKTYETFGFYTLPTLISFFLKGTCRLSLSLFNGTTIRRVLGIISFCTSGYCFACFFGFRPIIFYFVLYVCVIVLANDPIYSVATITQDKYSCHGYETNAIIQEKKDKKVQKD